MKKIYNFFSSLQALKESSFGITKQIQIGKYTKWSSETILPQSNQEIVWYTDWNNDIF